MAISCRRRVAADALMKVCEIQPTESRKNELWARFFHKLTTRDKTGVNPTPANAMMKAISLIGKPPSKSCIYQLSKNSWFLENPKSERQRIQKRIADMNAIVLRNKGAVAQRGNEKLKT